MADDRATRLRAAEQFLTDVYGGADGDVVLFTAPGNASRWCSASDLDAVAEQAVALADGQKNVYVSACVLDPAKQAPGKRGTAGDVVVVPAVWADIDIAGPAHASNDLPPDLAAALALLDELGLPPTLVVDSGHGIQPWWCLEPRLTLNGADQRPEARALNNRLQGALRALAAEHGWGVDPTDDLARVLRLPGTLNLKVDGDPRPVVVLAGPSSGRRYRPQEIGTHLDRLGAPSRPTGSGTKGGDREQVDLGQTVTMGSRTKAVESIAGTMLRRSIPQDVALAAASGFAARYCEPPLDPAKVEATVAGIYGRYEPVEPLIAAEPTWADRFDFPDPPHPAAYYGLAGDIVRTLGPHTEGAPVAVLGQFAAAFGNAVGPRPFFQVGGDHHRANIFSAIVAPTASGRKGSGLSVALLVIEKADGAWASEAKVNGLATGQGLVHHARDPRTNAKGDIVDSGAVDKRVFAVETEFTRVLVQAAQPGSVLSMVLRQAWDGETLRTLTKTDPERATGAHVSMVVHTTPADLREHLGNVEIFNGFANRYVWLASKRERSLPSGGNITAELTVDLIQRTAQALRKARDIGKMTRDAAAARLWADFYDRLAQERHGAFGAAVARAEAQVLRLSMIYALTDGSAVIREEHLRAAFALWDYCERSALWIFGTSTGDRDADYLLAELRAVYPAGMKRKELRDQLSRHRPVDPPLRVLGQQGLASWEKSPSEGGRPAEVWRAEPNPPSLTSVALVQTSIDPNGQEEGEHPCDTSDISVDARESGPIEHCTNAPEVPPIFAGTDDEWEDW